MLKAEYVKCPKISNTEISAIMETVQTQQPGSSYLIGWKLEVGVAS